MASSSSSSGNPQLKTCDVFISFSGEDVRKTFLSHLIEALRRKQINAFKDENLERGEEISPALLNIIKESYVSVVIFSKSYPYSSWCLDELAQILECHKEMKQIVLPVFYKMNPSDVQELKGNFEEALSNHIERFRDKVEIWRTALEEISVLAGFVSSKSSSEACFVENIANEVSKKLSKLVSCDSPNHYLIGIYKRVKKVESLFYDKPDPKYDAAQRIGIWGTGGIGKTTLAYTVFNRLKTKFDCHCFVENVAEKLKTKSTHELQNKIRRRLLGDCNVRMLPSKKVLLVLDDVYDSVQSQDLLMDFKSFHPGSKIILTSRDKQVLKNAGAKEYIYEVEELYGEEAIQLFSLCAFHRDHPEDGYMELSRRAIRYAEGIPLALKVFGSNLYGKGIKIWEEELKILENTPNKQIQKLLQRSVEGLEKNEKDIFLDIACLIRESRVDAIKRKLQVSGFFPEAGLSTLSDKSLVTTRDNYLQIHDLIRKVGKNIVFQENTNNPGKRSRLWNPNDISLVFASNIGTEKVEGILLDFSEIRNIKMSSTAFEHMHNLRYLEIYTYGLRKDILHLPNGLAILPHNLRYLCWDGYPLESLPLNFIGQNLVEFRMRFSKLKQLWDDNQHLGNLKCIDVTRSDGLIKIPDFSTTQNLVILNLMGCVNLVEIPSSIETLGKLTEYDLTDCIEICRVPELPRNITELKLSNTRIMQLPSNISRLSQVHELNLALCGHLTSLPEYIANLFTLEKLSLFECSALERLPDTIGCLTSLKELSLDGCSNLESLPDSICHLYALTELDISYCAKLKRLPEDFGDLCSLKSLIARASGLESLPYSINDLYGLNKLDCSKCEDLTFPLLTGLSSLYVVHLDKCYFEEFPEVLCSLKSLGQLWLRGNCFDSIPRSIINLSYLYTLDISDCTSLRFLPELPSNLTSLYATNCTFLELEADQLDVSHFDELQLGNCTFITDGDCSKILEHAMERHLQAELKTAILYIPGSEIPQKMRYQSSWGSSLCLSLDQHELVALSLCAVVKWDICLELSSDADELSADADVYPEVIKDILCKANFSDEFGNSHEIDCRWTHYYDTYLYFSSENVFLWRVPQYLLPQDRFSRVSFQFSVECYDKSESGNSSKLVIACGVHPIFKDTENEDDEDGGHVPTLEHDEYEDEGHDIQPLKRRRRIMMKSGQRNLSLKGGGLKDDENVEKTYQRHSRRS